MELFLGINYYLNNHLNHFSNLILYSNDNDVISAILFLRIEDYSYIKDGETKYGSSMS